jgi:LAS superfamily LD-carboxypeptidase LdcB
MKFAALIFSGILIIGLLFFAQNTITPSYESLMAAALKVELNALKTWQRKGGIQKTLAYGSQNQEVKLLQYILKTDESLPRVETTGYYGSMTKEAVKKFQEKNGLEVTGTVGPKTQEKINELYFNELCPSQTEEFKDLTYARVDKTHALPAGYTPKNLVNITDKVKTQGITCLTQEAADALIAMFKAAEQQGIYLAVSSSFRREEIQAMLHTFWLQYDYADNIDKIAEARHSEHQLGTAVDLTGKSIGYNGTDNNFDLSVEGQWLALHAPEYGFVMSYPRGKKDMTGYDPEPWHFRYVGIDMARQITTRGIAPGEFFAQFE